MRKARAIVLGLAILALAMLAASGPGTAHGWWSWRVGLTMFSWAAYVGMAAAAAALALILLLAVPKWRARPWLPVVALCVALAAVAPPLILRGQAREVPPIHDITTDFADPPAFVALLRERGDAPNPPGYDAEAAPAQQRAYADIKPLVVAKPPREALQAALDAARSLGWEVVGSDAAAGRVEATDTTAFFGFKDDVVIRVRPEGEGSRIDVRSKSRVGKSDIGANAARVRKLLAKLA